MNEEVTRKAMMGPALFFSIKESHAGDNSLAKSQLSSSQELREAATEMYILGRHDSHELPELMNFPFDQLGN